MYKNKISIFKLQAMQQNGEKLILRRDCNYVQTNIVFHVNIRT